MKEKLERFSQWYQSQSKPVKFLVSVATWPLATLLFVGGIAIWLISIVLAFLITVIYSARSAMTWKWFYFKIRVEGRWQSFLYKKSSRYRAKMDAENERYRQRLRQKLEYSFYRPIKKGYEEQFGNNHQAMFDHALAQRRHEMEEN